MSEKQSKNTEHLVPWKPGQSGNPAGRPKKDLCLISLVKEEFEKEAMGKDADGNLMPLGMTKAQAFARALVNQAIKGHNVAIKELLDRIDGKIPDVVDLKAKVSDETRRDENRTVKAALESLKPDERQRFFEALKFARGGSVAGTA